MNQIFLLSEQLSTLEIINKFGGLVWFIPWCLGVATLIPTALPWLATPLESDSFPAFFPKHAKPAAKVAGSIALVSWFFFFLKETEEKKNHVEIIFYATHIFLWCFGPLLLLFWVIEKIVKPWRNQVSENRRREERRKLEAEQRSLENERRQHERQLQEQSERTRSSEQKRRGEARFACQMLYDRHRSELVEKFSPEQLETYFDKYLTDQHAADEVEQRAKQLQSMLNELLDGTGAREEFGSVIEIREHYQQDRLQIQESSMDVDIKETLIAELCREEERAIREFRQR